MAEDEIGIRPELDLSVWNRNVQEYISGLNRMVQATVSSATNLDSAFSRILASGSKITASSAQLSGVATGYQAAINTIGAAVGRITSQTAALNAAVQRTGDAFLNSSTRFAQAANNINTASTNIVSSLRQIQSLRGATAPTLNVIVNRSALRNIEAFAQAIQTAQRATSALNTANLDTFAIAVSALSGAMRSVQPQRINSISSAFTQLSSGLTALGSVRVDATGLMAASAALTALSTAAKTIQPGRVMSISQSISVMAGALSRFGAISVNTTSLATLATSITGIGTALRTTTTARVAGFVTGLEKLITAIRGLSAGINLTPFNQLATAIQRIGAAIASSSGGFSSFNRNVQQASSSLSSGVGASNSFFSSLRQGLTLGAGFAIVQQGIQGILAGFSSLVRQAVQVAVAFEEIQFTLESQLALEAQSADATLSFNDALAQVKDTAQGYFLLIQQMAISESKFTAAELGRINSLLTAYDFVTEQAFEWTSRLNDFASARGKTIVTLEQIANSLGQMGQKGRITGEELRELSRAGIPIITALAEELGVSTSEVIKLVEDRAVSADQAFAALEKSFARFEGSGKRASLTVDGILSSFLEIRDSALRATFTGIFDPLRESLSGLVAELSSPTALASFQVFGEVIGQVVITAVNGVRNAVNSLIASWTALTPETQQVILTFAGATLGVLALGAAIATTTAVVGVLAAVFSPPVLAVAALVTAFLNYETVVAPLVNRVSGVIQTAFNTGARIFNIFVTALSSAANAIAGILNQTGQAFGSFINVVADAFSFGANLAVEFANGIISAVGAVVDAVSAIGSAISFLMAPGSPPRFLPEIDQWGTETATVYLEGWKDADFSAIDSVGRTIEQILSKTAIDPIALNVSLQVGREGVANAVNELINTGGIAEATITALTQQLGSAGDEVAGILTRYAALSNANRLVADGQRELTEATKAYEDAQRQVNDITRRYQQVLDPLTRQLNQLSNAQDRLADDQKIRELQRIVNGVGISRSRKAEAQAEIEQIRLKQQIALIEQQRDAELTTANQTVDATKEKQELAQQDLSLAQERQTQAQQEYDLFQRRIDAQTTQMELQQRYIELINQQATAVSGVAEKQKEGLSPLEKQLKIIQLQQAELNDMIELAKAQRVLEDEKATAAEKAAAQFKIQEISLRQQLRDVEAAELGTTLDSIRQIPIALEDIEKSRKGKGLEAVASDADSVKAKVAGMTEKTQGALRQFEDSVGRVRQRFDEMKQSVIAAANTLNEKLPTFLRIFPEGAQTQPPIVTTLTELSGLLPVVGAAFTASRVIPFVGTLASSLGGLAGALGAGKLAGALAGAGAAISGLAVPITIGIAAVGGLYVAYQRNWLGIRDVTDSAASFVSSKMQTLWRRAFGDATLTESLGIIRQNLGTFFAGLGDLVSGQVTPQSEAVRVAFAGWRAAATDWTAQAALNLRQWIVNLPTTITGIVTSAAATLATAFANWREAAIDWTVQAGQAVADWIVNLPATIRNFAMNGQSTLTGAFLSWVTAASQWTINASASMIRGLGTAIGNLTRWIIGSAAPLLVEAGLQLALAIVRGYIGAVNLVAGITSAAVEVGRWVTANRSQIQQYGVDMAVALFTGFVRLSVDVAKWLPGFVGDIGKTINTTLRSAIVSLGTSIGEGIRDGISQFWENTSLDEVFRGLIDGVKRFFGISSPSKLFVTEVGVPLAQGLLNGFVTGIRTSVQDAVDAVLDWRDRVFSSDTILSFFAIGNARLGTNVITGFTTAITNPITAIQEGLTALGVLQTGVFNADTERAWFVSGNQSLGQRIIDGLTTLITDPLKAFEAVKSSLQTLRTSAVEAAEVVTAYLASGRDNLGASIVQGIKDFLSDPLAAIQSLVDAILSMIRSVISTELLTEIGNAALAIGNQIVAGIKKGIDEKIKDIRDYLTSWAESLPQWMQSALGISSPSQVFADEVGAPIADGVRMGIEEQRNAVNRAVADLVNVPTVDVGAIVTGQDGALRIRDAFADLSSDVTVIARSMVDNIIAEFGRLSSIDTGLLAGNRLASRGVTTAGLSQADVQSSSGLLSAQPTQVGASITNNYNITKIYNLNLAGSAPSQGVVQDFRLFELMAA